MPLTPRRPAFAAILISILGAMALMSMAQAAPKATSTNAIVARALQEDGTWQGECWTWMRKVVEEATGKAVGFDYRKGFFEAGAVEVSPKNARAGDIIQLADDSYTAPDADYSGLHTAIVMENLGNGKFLVIDSNSNWDGVVRIREYDPGAAAARYPNISYRVYRIPNVGEVLVPDVIEPEPVAQQPYLLGDLVTVNTPGDCLNIRTGAGSNFAAITCLKDKTSLKIAGPTVKVAGRNWTKVTSPSGTGWVATDFLSRPTGAGGAGTGITKPAPAFRLFIGGVVGQ